MDSIRLIYINPPSCAFLCSPIRIMSLLQLNQFFHIYFILLLGEQILYQHSIPGFHEKPYNYSFLQVGKNVPFIPAQ